MPYDRPAPALANSRFSQPDVQRLPLVVIVLIAPTAKHAMAQRMAAAMTPACGSEVQAKGTTEGSEPTIK